MTWENGFASWEYYGVSSQPAAVLVDSAGNELGSWRGFPAEEILAAAEAAS